MTGLRPADLPVDPDEAIDCFCGAGGATRGLIAAGYRVHGYDAWDTAVRFHTDTVGPATLIDLSTTDPALERRPAVGWFSPPCQAWSAAGDHAGEDDERDGFPWTLRIIARYRPLTVIIENVPGLAFEAHRDYLDQVLADLRALGYDVSWRILCAADYGVPQTRRRLFIIGRCDGLAPVWPEVTHTEEAGLFTEQWVSMAAALGLEPGQRLNTGLAWKKGGTRDDAQKIPATSPAPAVTGKSQSQWQVTSPEDDAWYWTRPATTIAGDTRVWPPGHKINAADIAAGRGGGDRAGTNAVRVSLEGMAVLQGFPPGLPWDASVDPGGRAKLYPNAAKLIGNAVPPRLAQVLVEANRPRAMRVAA